VQVDDTDVFWSEVVPGSDGKRALKVLAAPKRGGGAVRELGSWNDYQASESMVLDATHVGFLFDGKLVRVTKDGAQRMELPLPDVRKLDPGPLLDLGDAVLVGGHACKALARVPKDGSAPQLWTVSQQPITGGDTGIEADGPLLYCASGHHLHQLDTRTGEVRELLAYGGKAGAMRRVGKDLYWYDSDNPDLKNTAIVRLAEGSRQPVAIGSAFGGATRLLFDESRNKLYWLTGLNSHGCTLGVAEVGGDKTATLAANLDNWGAPAQDAEYVYWPASHSIVRTRK
jgi:hypothetical protein